MSATKFNQFDVRELLRGGREPLPEILSRVAALRKDEGLMIIAPFLPSPLIRLLGDEGFRSRAEQRAAAEWVVYFWRDQEAAR
jgi:uncharacterized protein (DUF2249 family)